jgi:hypothetical protein
MAQLRDRFLQSIGSHKTKVIELTDSEGEKMSVLIKELSVSQKNSLFQDVDPTGKTLLGGAKTDYLVVQAVIACVLDPETQRPLFTAQDEALLLSDRSNGMVEKLAGEILQLSQDAEKSAKN